MRLQLHPNLRVKNVIYPNFRELVIEFDVDVSPFFSFTYPQKNIVDYMIKRKGINQITNGA